MKVRYIGTDDLTEDPQTEAFGTVFTKGEWEEMADVPSQLLTNPVFETSDELEAEAKVGYETMTVKALKALASERGVDLADATLKADIIALIQAQASPPPE